VSIIARIDNGLYSSSDGFRQDSAADKEQQTILPDSLYPIEKREDLLQILPQFVSGLSG
jgi:hypothetical protein